MSEILVSAENLTKRYGTLNAVDNVSLTIQKGAIVGLVGKNGAGKTTLIRLLTGLSMPTSGTYCVLPGQTRRDTSVAALIEKPSLYNGMTAMENLRAQCKLLCIEEDEKYLAKTLDVVGLCSTRQKVKNFSYGMRQRLAIAIAIVGKPDLLILDEPTNGLDPEGIRQLRELFVLLNKEMGVTLLISSHILAELQKFATEFLVMHNGKIVKHATAEELGLSARRLRISVDNVELAKEVLSALGETAIVDENTIDLFGEIQPTQVLLLLAQKGVVATNIVSLGESLEDFFIEAVGGAR